MRITWWGHASTTVEIGGVRLLSDPALTQRLAHLHRLDSAAPANAARHADAVLISHLHADHLHLPSLRLVDSATVIVPSGGAKLVRRAGCPDIREVEQGDVLDLGGVQVTAVHAEHDGRRMPGSSHRGPALGYLLRAAGRTVWFAGDTGRFDGLEKIGPVDVAIVPVGGWGPTLGDGHLDPEQAAEVVREVGATHAVPIHFGTFWPIGFKPLAPGIFRRMFHEPGQRFAAAAPASTTVHVLACGESLDLPDGDADGEGAGAGAEAPDG